MDSINTDIIKSEPKEETNKLNSITTCDNSLSIKSDAEVVSNNSNLDLNTDDLNSALSNKNNLSNSVNENLLKGVENTTEYSSSNSNSIKNDFNKLPEIPEIKKESLSPSSNILTGGLNKTNMNNLNNGVVPNIGNMSMPCNNSNIISGPINNSNINNNLKSNCKLNSNVNNLINPNTSSSGTNSKNIEPSFETRYSQVQSLVYVFPTQLANEAAEAVAIKRSESLVAYHAGQEKTKKFIEDNSLKNMPVQKNWNNNMPSNKRNKQSPSLSSSNSQSNNLNNQNNSNSNASSSPFVYRPPSNSSVVSNASNSYRPGQSPGMTNDLNNWNSPDINMEWPSPQQQTNNFINTGSNLRTSINNNSNLMPNNSGSNQACYQEQNNINKVNKDNLSREKKLEKIKQLKENLMVSDGQQLSAYPMSSEDGMHRNNWPNDLQEPPFSLNQQSMNSNSPFIEDIIGNNLQQNIPNGLNISNNNGSNNRRRKVNSNNNAQQTGQQQCGNLSHVSPISQPSSSLNSPNPNIAPSPSQQRINNGNSTTPVPVGSNPPPPYSPATSSVSSIRLPPYASPGPPTPSSIDSTILGNNNIMNQNNSSGGQPCKNQFNLANSPKSVLSSNMPINSMNNQIGIDHNGPISPAAKKCKSLSSTPCMDMNNLDNSVGSDFMNSSLPNNSNMSIMKNGSNPALCKLSSMNEPQLMPVPSPQKIQYLPDFEGQELTIQKQPNTSIQVSELGSDLPFLSELSSPNSYPLQNSNSNSVIGPPLPNNVQNNSNVNQMNNQNQFNRMSVNSPYNPNHIPIPNQQQMISQPNSSLPPSNMMIENNNMPGGSNQIRFNSNNQYDARMQHSSFNSTNNSNMMNMNNRFEIYGNRMPNQQNVPNSSMNQFKNQLINPLPNNDFNSSVCPSSHMPLPNMNEPPISSNHLQNLQKMALPFDIGIPKIDNNSSINTSLSQNSFSSNIVNNGPSNSHQFDSSLMTSNNNNSSINSSLSRSNNNPLINNEVNQLNCNQPMPPGMANQNYRIPNSGPGMISNSQSIGNFPSSNVSSISNINNLGPPNQQIPPNSNQYHPNQIEPDSYNLHPGANSNLPNQTNLHPLQNSQAPPNSIPNTYINSNVVPPNCNQIIQNNQPIMNGPMGGQNPVGRPSPNTLMMNSMGNSHNANFPPTSNSVSPKLGISQSPIPSQMIMNGNGSLPSNQRMMNASNPINNYPGPMNQHIQGQRVPPMNFNGGPNFSLNSKMPPSTGPIQNTNRPPFNSTNVQMNNSKPNTIQYLPSRPLNPTSNHNQRPPTLDFRYGNPVDPKMGMQNLQHFPGNGPPMPNNNSIQQGPNLINSNLQPPNSNLVNAPGRQNILLMQRGNNGPQNPNNMINDNSMMSNNMYRNGLGIPENGLHPMNGNPPSMPNAQMSNPIYNKNITPPMMNTQPGDIIMSNNNYGCGPPVNNMSSFNNNTNQFNNNMMVPGQGQPNNSGYNKNFYSPTNDPNYDNSSYHNFQRQLYATNTNNSSGN